MEVLRHGDGPLIDRGMDESLGTNINGPCLVRVPSWVPEPLGRYYLYFAHHQGQFIRLAYADELAGPYTLHAPGVLSIEETPMRHHVASPDVHVEEGRLLMHYHGCTIPEQNTIGYGQATCAAVSGDGLRFASDAAYIGQPYLRSFRRDGWFYGFAGGPRRRWSRSRERRGRFAEGPALVIEGEDFTDWDTYDRHDPAAPPVYRMRHVALDPRGDELRIYYSCVGDRPERIKRTRVDLRGGWETWRGTAPEEVLAPATPWEGAEEPLVASAGGSSHEPVHELRDPFIYREAGRTYLLYATAGEQGIALAEIRE